VTLGPKTQLLSHARVQGPITLGSNCVVYPFACLGMAPQDRKFDPQEQGAGIVIGDDNVFRESFTVHRATGDRPTTIGHRNYFMANSHVGHDCLIGNDCTIANGVLFGGHCELGDKVMFGGNAGMHQFCRIGRLAMVSGITPVVQDVPPFCTVYTTGFVGSLNLVGLRRGGYRDSINALKRAFDILYRQRHTNTTACDLIEAHLGHDPLCLELARFVRASKRGITAYRKSDSLAPTPV
jgi:UDP-N-acetylglucosamine acyltransferase